MKKLALLCTLASCFSFVAISGCGGGDGGVVEVAEDTPTEDASMPGMTEEEYQKAMDEDMNN
jgi:hypothetical protein